MNYGKSDKNEDPKMIGEDFRILVDGIRDHAVFMLDQTGTVLTWNTGAQLLKGYLPQEIIGKHFSIFFPNEDNQNGKPKRILESALANGSYSETGWRVRRDGSRFLANVSVSVLKDESDQLIGFAKVLRNANDGSLNPILAKVIPTASLVADSILIADQNANIIRVNQAFRDLTGYSAEELQGKNVGMLSSGRHDTAFYTAMWDALHTRAAWSGEVWDKRKDGREFKTWVNISAIKNDYGDTVEYVAVYKDLSEQKALEEQTNRLAYFDALTNLPNRRLLMDRLQMAFASSSRFQQYGALLLLDIDNFKAVNDTLGHDFGDQLLIQVASRMRACIRENDTVARLGGDEFVVLFELVDKTEERCWNKVGLIAEKIRAALAEPYVLKNREFLSSPSIGVTLFSGSEETIETVLKYADIAMYQAKEAGRNTVRFFDPYMQKAVEARALLESELTRAVPDRQLRLYYQLQVDNAMLTVGAEAYVRWIHPTGGIISPAQFIPIAEESSLILKVGQWVLETACEQLAQWSKSPATRDLILAVNVSAQQFRMSDFVESVAAVVHSHNIKPGLLRLEFTESVVLNDVPDLVLKLSALRELGVLLSLDDFGTGYSSLSYLKQLPLDQLKIDGSFVHDITSPHTDTVMVETIIAMATKFGLNIIAEGVEHKSQLEFLKQHGCHAYQGYLFSEPMPIEEFDQLLAGRPVPRNG